tara:strand:+ start:5252 stop:5980 length:729 start_codon:yes stop_codon:yes gene_type:complete
MFIYNSIPTVVVQDNVITPAECKSIISLAKSLGLREQEVNKKGKTKSDSQRSSTGIGIDVNYNDSVHEVTERLAAICRIPLSHSEPMNIQRYIPGQKYTPHYDAARDSEEMPPEFYLKESGNRSVTMIAYLNDVEGGGGTGFPNLGFVVKAFTGRILMFGNLDEKSDAHPLSLHMGMEPSGGEKWMFTLWFREKEYMSTKKALEKKGNKKAKKKPNGLARQSNRDLHKEIKNIVDTPGRLPL